MPKSLATAIVLLLCPVAFAAESVSFRREVLPILTKHGCNAGACHGTPSGKNGFRLSLRGYDAELDQYTLTREHLGRRLDRIDPDASLLLTKASGQTAHEGGKRFDVGDRSYQIIRGWIAGGATDDMASSPVRLSVSPPSGYAEPLQSPITLRVSARFEPVQDVEVTHLVRFSSSDETIAQVSPEGLVHPRSRGEATIVAEYMGMMVTANIIVREGSADLSWAKTLSPGSNLIDRHTFARWQELRIEPSSKCADHEFLRRCHLDVTGRLPTPERVRSFLADTRTDKRARLIDELLEQEEFADWWGQKWADRLGVNQRFVGKIGAVKYHRWIRDQIAQNVPEDEFARRIITGSGGNYSNPPAGFYRRLRDPLLRAEEVSQLFLGVRIGCAKCHNHPGERWTQDDYYGFAAFFARLAYRQGPFFIQIYDKEETILVTRTGEVTHPHTGKEMEPKFLGGATPTVDDSMDRREVFANWLTAPDNPFFARAAVNRIWYHLFGRGLVDPVDDFRISNPPSHPELLNALAKEFIAAKFDRKHLIRLVLNSRTYQLSSGLTKSNAGDERFFSHAVVRRLGAEQLLDAIADASGASAKFPGMPMGTPAVLLPDGEYKHPFLEAFGRPARAMACECERETDTTLSQALHLSGGKSFDGLIRHPEGRIARLMQSQASPEAIVEELFLATLSRQPSVAEREIALKRYHAVDTERRRTVSENLLHALLNHPEFVFQH